MGARKVNDDAAEKKKRRQSMRQSILPTSSPKKQIQVVEESPLLPVFQQLSEEEINGMYNEWMKIAADNKINATNTWNVALIDYFHDLSMLKEGDSINFQKASVTLDGCIKVYSSRIDSVSSETNKLLSGLSSASDDSGKPKKDDEDENEVVDAPAKKKSARAIVTLEHNPENLKFQTLDCNLHLTVDPLFKKTSAEFDEGGATGLLLNRLSTGYDGRLIFSSSDAAASTTSTGGDSSHSLSISTLNITKLKEKHIGALESIWNRDICPSFKTFSFMNPSHENKQELPVQSQPIPPAIIADDIDDQDPISENGFGDFNDAGDDEDEKFEAIAPSLCEKEELMQEVVMDTSHIAPQHWRLERFAKIKGPAASTTETSTVKKRREKKQFKIDFLDGEDISRKTLFGPKGGAAIRLPETKGALSSNLLKDDSHFLPKQLKRLFTKPLWTVQTKVASFSEVSTQQADGLDGTINATFFEDDDDDSNGAFSNADSNIDLESTDLVAKPKTIRKIQINFARTAKRVDVKKLKDNLWHQMTHPDGQSENTPPTPNAAAAPQQETIKDTLLFSNVVQTLPQLYPANKIADVSVSFCFICLLHLANEKNLSIEAVQTFSDLRISQNV